MGKRKTPAKSSKAKQPTITSHALPLPKKPMELVGKQIGVPGAWWEGTRRTRSKAARPAHALCAAAERRAGSGAPGRGAAWPGERPGWTTRGWERRLRRAGTSVFTEYSLFMMNRRCSTHSHELERGRSIQVMNILRAVNSTQVILFITRPAVRPSVGLQRPPGHPLKALDETYNRVAARTSRPRSVGRAGGCERPLYGAKEARLPNPSPRLTSMA